MKVNNFEFKARVADINPFEQRLLKLHPEFRGEDHQIDTYSKVAEGRLKLREGNVENALIQYRRDNTSEARLSSVILYKCAPDPALKTILSIHMPVWKVVDKIRRIYYLDNVKFHFDIVRGLGQFVEVEAADIDGKRSIDQLHEQCIHYRNYLMIDPDAIVADSYSDMM